MDLQLREVQSVIAALDARKDVSDLRMLAIVVPDQAGHVVVGGTAFDAAEDKPEEDVTVST